MDTSYQVQIACKVDPHIIKVIVVRLLNCSMLTFFLLSLPWYQSIQGGGEGSGDRL